MEENEIELRQEVIDSFLKDIETLLAKNLEKMNLITAIHCSVSYLIFLALLNIRSKETTIAFIKDITDRCIARYELEQQKKETTVEE